jgi:hypothetical protein
MLKFMVLQGASYIYDISRLRVKSKGKVTGKGKVHPRTRHEGPEREYR